MPIDVLIFDAIRTPRTAGKSTGELHEVKPVKLVATLLEELRSRFSLDTSKVDDVILGCVTPVGEQGANIGKTSAIVAGWDESVAGVQLNRFCASGLDAVNVAAMKVASGWESLVVAGGVESMSRVTMGSDGGAVVIDPEVNTMANFIPQGLAADLLATLEDFTRAEVDQYAVESQGKAARAITEGWFERSVIPVLDANGLTIVEKDSFVKTNTTLEALAGLPASFELLGNMGFSDIARSVYPQISKINHVHTPGNSSGIVDGASAVLIGSRSIEKELGLKPRARIIAAAVTSTEPTIMLTGPGPAAQKALKIAGLSVDDIDLFEVNEAFSSVVLRFMKDLDVPTEKVNVNGGAIALGHPLGATGGMLVGTLLDELERRKLRRGLITMCVGGGIGIATIIETV